ncbi:intermembrane phospholipid transport protein YdbH family protein [Gilliamella sp. wkB112]|uniref:intermembrane phospholipid transport protein YdbH family protein n=1 Tax=Gilliamella sp. wkB112 TaxID=3120257 RepID=UPI00080DDB33|nr:YdbH domain-containing protein [Gilliamella apicola]OCG00486.1 hypothetical protein A9G12_05205 [Gilliamella apicola]
MTRLKKRYWILLSFLLIILFTSLIGWHYWCSFKQKYDLSIDWSGAKISLDGITFDEITISQHSQLSIIGKNLLISWSQLTATDLDIHWQQSSTTSPLEPVDKVVDESATNLNLSAIDNIFYWLPKTIHVDSLRWFNQENELYNFDVDITKQQQAIRLTITTNDHNTIKLVTTLTLNQKDSRIDLQDGLLTAMFNQSEIINGNITLPFIGWITNDQLSLTSSDEASFSLEKLNISQDLMFANSAGKIKLQVQSKIPLTSEQISATAQLIINKLNGIYLNSEIKSASGIANVVVKDNQVNIAIPALNIQQVNVGIVFEKVKLAGTYAASLKAINKGILTWTQAKANIFSGSVALENNKLNLAKLPQQFNVRLKQIQLKDIFAKYPVEGLAAEGSIDGSLPVTLLASKKNNATMLQLMIKNGQLVTLGEGYLQFENAALKSYEQSNPNMKILTDILKNFHYTKLTGKVDYANDIAKLGLNIQGSNLDVENGKAVNLNITLEENVAKLMTSLLLSDQISEPIRKRIEARLKK